MPINTALKQAIQESLRGFESRAFDRAACDLFATLGYSSEKSFEGFSGSPEALLAEIDPGDQLNREKALAADWQEAHFLFQITDHEINTALSGQGSLFQSDQVERNNIQSYLFLAIRLGGEHYTRTQLAAATREINRLFPMPALVLFTYDQRLTLSIITRRTNKRDASRDVLEKVTLIKDISIQAPNRGQIEILHDLALATLSRDHPLANFTDLQRAWEKTLDISELNKRFYREVADWYFWAVSQVKFPADAEPDEEKRNAVGVIRLITRLIFVWFLKEKELVPDDLFNDRRITEILKPSDPQAGVYYRAVLQNLFFATLNTEMGAGRRFRGKNRSGGMDAHYGISSVYRYEDAFQNPAEALKLYAGIPFLNGGLFECLDRREEKVFVDGFSDTPRNQAVVPDWLFFGAERQVDLSEIYGDTHHGREQVRGLIPIFQSYKFTIEENTPLEEEVALDPELLGKVFENLLATYNPETKTTARKQTGSFYTPREIVNYMVDEALLAALEGALPPGTPEAQPRLRRLLAYEDQGHDFTTAEATLLVEAVSRLKALDPACGSGAFPMGLLHKLVHVLRKLDPENDCWREIQRKKAVQETEEAFRIGNKDERRKRLDEIDESFERNLSDYGRKLYLIENCIYGVDIQPIAVQISKLRFFISLVVDQRADDARPNRGIRELPNLETKFVAANSLIGIPRPQQMTLRNPEIDQKEAELAEVRRQHFAARTLERKRALRRRDEQIRFEMGDLLEKDGFPRETTELLVGWDPYDQNVFAAFFDPEWMFGVTSGFDVVISNPPYVRAEQITEQKPGLQKQFTCYTGTADLYVYFYERGFQVLRDGGVLVYISSNKYFRSGYGEKLRRFLAVQRIDQIIDFGDAPVFDAIAYPSIIVVRKALSTDHVVHALTWHPGQDLEQFAEIFNAHNFTMPQFELKPDGWRLESDAALRLLEKLKSCGKPLGEYVNGKLYRGILTGLNEAFVVDQATRDRLIAEHPTSEELLKPLLRGRDVKRWRVDYNHLYLIQIESSENKHHPWSGLTDSDAEHKFSECYPAIYNHLLPYRDALIQRDDQGKYFWELRSCRYWAEFDKRNITWGNLAIEPKFAFSPSGYSICAPANIVVSESQYLLGILNSRVTHYLVSQSAAERQGGFVEYKPMYIYPLAIPAQPPNEQITSLVSQILGALDDNPESEVSNWEPLLNQEVYKLYQLSQIEITLIEDAAKYSGGRS